MRQRRWHEKRMVIRGQVYRIVEWSKRGYPLLLLHGFMGSALDFATIADRFASSRRVLAIDFLGHAKSSSPEDPRRYRMEQIIQDIATLLDACGIFRTDMLGYSMGGRVALAFATVYSKKVRSLILESASPGLAIDFARMVRREADELLVKQMRSAGLRHFVDRWEQLPLFASQTLLSEELLLRQRLVRLSHTIIGLSGSLQGLGTGVQRSYWPVLEQIHLPVLLITGQLDKKFTGIAQDMKPLLHQVAWQSIDGVGHNTHLENPNAFFYYVSCFLNQVKNVQHK